VTKEAEAVKLHRDTTAGGYDLVATGELKKMIDEGKDMIMIDTMPYEDSYKKEHVPGALQFLFPIPDMKEWNDKETGGQDPGRLRSHARARQEQNHRHLLRFREMHAQPQRRDLGQEARLQQRLPLPRRHLRLEGRGQCHRNGEVSSPFSLKRPVNDKAPDPIVDQGLCRFTRFVFCAEPCILGQGAIRATGQPAASPG
jgi:hypothetical protein